MIVRDDKGKCGLSPYCFSIYKFALTSAVQLCFCSSMFTSANIALSSRTNGKVSKKNATFQTDLEGYNSPGAMLLKLSKLPHTDTWFYFTGLTCNLHHL